MAETRQVIRQMTTCSLLFAWLFTRTVSSPVNERHFAQTVLLGTHCLDYSAEKENELMDPITTAIVAALSAGVISGLTEAGKQVIRDAYDGLKALLKKKFGSQSEVMKSVESLEAKPESPSRQGMLQEEVQAVHADQDPDLLQAAQALLDQIKVQPGGEQHIQNAIGSYIAHADRGSTATVNVNRPPEER